ncbi:MAG: 1-(5-phosphoribosyl)-5-[(5-phosphoribosylamino)methylideneamino]imidazole-4-carboxamide isomerase [Chloroflexi bacterium]|nr:1-(5-phosphoribosyl)-5-[(5-phosphoribosylamino)methylideneamino]imidazole-4-carboxamide isomerase [Chloroflexota bacterium]MCI0813723.1 1-(5-phosphoribosyl)-5-[(5-phosphoribosylamino)methylideneamino]imidazole-4-carboxamide isomerase [Chloroflexota bacterium]MCI0817598.1 1-(5-phosphoribosyl)-5-[(5-phosphoribosylamino)methylideneamino]imidazole-4-carboxamide isomerase [Chloroflexota bacterium]MCI0820540.1 1-(5-phosphoribosyl)-5-[(5-phosphoribosylamino)methylideneamino]imidazole-4-carboxamide i
MEIIPAVDIRGGRCVRLDQGDYERETVFADDPVAVAQRWEKAGARRLHVVDLDGARDGKPQNEDVIRRVIEAVSVAVQVGGGVRDISVIDRYVKAGADRVAMGTAAVKDQTMLVNAVSLFRERIIVGVDARDGMAATEGWRETSAVRALDLVQQLSEFGVERIFFTDISRDGMLGGPNFLAIQEVVEHAAGLPSPMAVIASGGVSTVEHLKRLRLIGVEGVIIGMALYTGALDIAEALAAAEA